MPKSISYFGNHMGLLYVVDQENNRIQVFDKDYHFLYSWGTRGVAPGLFNGPSAIAIDGYNNIYAVSYTHLEPLTGYRLGQVHERRTKREFTQFCCDLAQAYPQARRIRLVLDNLNTHNASSFYEHLCAEEAYALAERFEFIYTPKGASWLNMIECEFSVLSRQDVYKRQV